MKVDHLKMIDRRLNLHPDIFEQIFGKLGSIDSHFFNLHFSKGFN